MTSPLTIDFHCHLDLYRNYQEVFSNIRKSNVRVFAVTTTPLAWNHNRELAADALNIRVGLGLHPQLVGRPEADIELFEKLAPEARYIGEIGLDAGPGHYKTYELQKEVLVRVLQACNHDDPKVLSFHSVRATKDLLSLLERHWPSSAGTPVLHWFSGTASEARQAVEQGCWFSINPRMGRTERSWNILKSLPLERMLTETDGPFVTSSNSRPLQPGEVLGALALISECLGLPLAEVQLRISQNFERLLQAHGEW